VVVAVVLCREAAERAGPAKKKKKKKDADEEEQQAPAVRTTAQTACSGSRGSSVARNGWGRCSINQLVMQMVVMAL
jgi:hypothetical protein